MRPHLCRAFFAILVALLSGCSSPRLTPAGSSPDIPNSRRAERPRRAPDQLYVWQDLSILFTDLPASHPDVTIDTIIGEDGAFTLLSDQLGTASNLVFKADGKTRGELEKELIESCVPKVFAQAKVIVRTGCCPKFFWIRGQVQSPGRRLCLPGETVLEAIESAGFTEIANPKKVRLSRSGRTYTLDCRQARTDPKLNLTVFPGDEIFVPRSWW